MRRAPRRAKHRRLSLPDRIAQHPREYARDGPVSMAVSLNLATWATCSIHKQDSSRRFSCNDTKVLLRVWFGSGVMGNEGTKREDVLMRCHAGKLAGTRTLRLQQAERAGMCDRVVWGVLLDRYCERTACCLAGCRGRGPRSEHVHALVETLACSHRPKAGRYLIPDQASARPRRRRCEAACGNGGSSLRWWHCLRRPSCWCARAWWPLQPLSMLQTSCTSWSHAFNRLVAAHKSSLIGKPVRWHARSTLNWLRELASRRMPPCPVRITEYCPTITTN